jgi:PRTRC genetic system ThiF family protein
MPHITPAVYLSHPVNITLIGCGGNGSQMLTGLARLNHAITALGHPGLRVTAFDGDTVSDANIGRQLFSPSDVGQHKSVVLVYRINAFFGLDWVARAQHCTVEEIRHCYEGIVVVCVDSARARALIAPTLRSRPGYVMDLGNRASDGQVVFGSSRKSVADSTPIPLPYDLLPELIDTTLPEDDTPSCGLAAALERQELFINQAIVTPALGILWEFFRHGLLSWHGAFVNLKTGAVRPLLVDR